MSSGIADPSTPIEFKAWVHHRRRTLCSSLLVPLDSEVDGTLIVPVPSNSGEGMRRFGRFVRPMSTAAEILNAKNGGIERAEDLRLLGDVVAERMLLSGVEGDQRHVKEVPKWCWALLKDNMKKRLFAEIYLKGGRKGIKMAPHEATARAEGALKVFLGPGAASNLVFAVSRLGLSTNTEAEAKRRNVTRLAT